VFGSLGRAPELQDSVVVDGVRLTVLEIEGSRIVKLEVELGVDDDSRPIAGNAGTPEPA
jgi:CBS domain containing-hemolysin-like protein